MIGRAAGLIGNVLADEGDEFDAFDDLADFADDEDALDALAPVVAGVALRAGLKRQVGRLPRAHRRRLVKTVTAAARHLARRHGPRAVRVMPAIVAHARKIAIRRRLHPRHLPRLVAQTARAPVRSPRALRKLARTSNRLRTARLGRQRYGGSARRMGRHRSRGRSLGMMGSVRRGRTHGGICPTCGRRRTMRFHGPVHLTIEAR
jgi:hypothetical protein